MPKNWRPIGLLLIAPLLFSVRGRVRADEAPWIADVKTVVAAEAAYSSVNSGYYDTLECLQVPVRCIPHYPLQAPTFLDEARASLDTRDGYARAFYTGAPAPHELVLHEKVSRTSVEHFAYVAMPQVVGDGGRSFCGDDSGVICFTSGAMPAIEDGRCPEACTRLR